MTRAVVRALPHDEVGHGHCFTTVEGLGPGQVVAVRAQSRTIYCRPAWDLGGRFSGIDEIVLDRWQLAALGAVPGQPVEVVQVASPTALPVADAVDLLCLSGGRTDDGALPGLPEFLAKGHYSLYPGLRFAFRPLAADETGEYEVVTVRGADGPIAPARAGDGFLLTVRSVPDTAGAWPDYRDLGGVDEAVALLRREVEAPLSRPAELRRIGVHAPSGVLVCGPPGSGKTALAKAVAKGCGADAVLLPGAALAELRREEAEEALRAAFEPVPEGATPRLVILDDVDHLVPRRDAPGGPQRYLGLVIELLDRPGRPVVVATSSRPDDVDPSVRRLGRLGSLIRLSPPGGAERRAILAVHTRDLAVDCEDGGARARMLDDLAGRTSGFVGADLAALCHEAGRIALRRAFPLESLDSEAPEPAAPALITAEDWTAALTFVTPSVLGSVVSETPMTSFADVAGLAATVEELRERLVFPLAHPEVFAEAGVPTERGVLLYGPPGTGKTLLARALAHECGRRFLAVRGPELLNKWFGESERAVRDLFERARHLAPSILFFDEIDALAPRRTSGASDNGAANRVVNQLLAELDGMQELGNVTVIGATNNPDGLDPAMVRPGRLGLHIEVPLPDHHGRLALFQLYLPDGHPSDYLEEYASRTEGMSGADIAMVVRESRLAALRRTAFTAAEPPGRDEVLQGITRATRSAGSRFPTAVF